MTVESMTFPNWEKNSRIDSEVTLPASPPMNSFVARWCSWRGIARLGSIYDLDEQHFKFDWPTPYNFAIQEVFPDHDRIHTCGVVECEECKAP
jgi:hypothetical protein